MNVLLDTCALLALSRGELPGAAAAALRAAPEVAVSAVAPWVIAIQAAAGKLRLGRPPVDWFEEIMARDRLEEIPLDFRTACTAAASPEVHRDPFDRVLVALAQQHSRMILTSDTFIARYPGIKSAW